jgi:hypothetical protein
MFAQDLFSFLLITLFLYFPKRKRDNFFFCFCFGIFPCYFSVLQEKINKTVECFKEAIINYVVENPFSQICHSSMKLFRLHKEIKNVDCIETAVADCERLLNAESFTTKSSLESFENKY